LLSCSKKREAISRIFLVLRGVKPFPKQELCQIKRRAYTILAKKAGKHLRNSKSDLGIPEMERLLIISKD
jgi:hypothetical protein